MKHTDDKSLLMIEPKEDKSNEPVLDNISNMANIVWKQCIKPDKRYQYRGFHKCICGERSDNNDWYTPIGRLTNSLMVHYIMYHRDEVPDEEINKLKEEYINYLIYNI